MHIPHLITWASWSFPIPLTCHLWAVHNHRLSCTTGHSQLHWVSFLPMVILNDRLFISTNGHTDFSSLSMVILNDTDFSSLPMVISSHTDLQLLLIIPNQINSPLLLVGPDHTKSSLSMVIPNQTDSPVSVVSPDHTKSLLSMVIPNHTDPPSYQCSFSVHSQAHCKLVTVFLTSCQLHKVTPGWSHSVTGIHIFLQLSQVIM